MPTYEYQCQKCRYKFERFQKITDKPLQRCPKCRSKVKKLIGAGAGIIFKGSGFYQTDYRSKEYNKDKARQETSGTAQKDSKADSPAVKSTETSKAK